MATYLVSALEERDHLLHKQREVNETDTARADVPRTADSQPPVNSPGPFTPAAVLQLQRSVGNRAVGQLLEDRAAAQVEAGQPQIQRRLEQEEELECPGGKIRSGGLGRGEGAGQGQGPIGYLRDEEW